MSWYGSAHVFALPSLNVGWKFEGYGLAHLEASAAGLPVIGTTDCGAADAIDDGVTGLLVTQAQVAERLPAAIIRLLSDPALAAQMIALYNEIGGE
jgi:phosphatidylinositol alpha-1,6-mannosyltransferase